MKSIFKLLKGAVVGSLLGFIYSITSFYLLSSVRIDEAIIISISYAIHGASIGLFFSASSIILLERANVIFRNKQLLSYISIGIISYILGTLPFVILFINEFVSLKKDESAGLTSNAIVMDRLYDFLQYLLVIFVICVIASSIIGLVQNIRMKKET